MISHSRLPVFLPILRLPPSRPNRNSLNRRFNGNLFGKISSLVTVLVVVSVEGAVDKFETELEPEPEPEFDIKLFVVGVVAVLPLNLLAE